MVSKLIPVAIGVILVVAAILGIVFVTTGEISVGAPFDVPYQECVHGLEQTGSFVRAVTRQSTEPCSLMISSEFCEAVVLRDEARCGEDTTCIAFVRADVSRCVEGDADCRAFVTGDEAQCDSYNITEIDSREECRALASKDARYFSSRRAKQNCVDSVVYTLASKESECDQISHADVKSACKDKFSS